MTSHTTSDSIESIWPDAVADLGNHTLGNIGVMLNGLTSACDVDLSVLEETESGWRVAVCMSDRLGLLSLVSALLTTFGLEIVSADTFSIDVGAVSDTDPVQRQHAPNRSTDRRRRRLRRDVSIPNRPSHLAAMVFEVRPRAVRDDDWDLPDWDLLEERLKWSATMAASGRLDQVHTSVIQGFADAMRQSGPVVTQRAPVKIETEVTASESGARLFISSVDTPGFLFALSNALSSINVNIIRSKVRTIDGQAHDTFWLTDPSGSRIDSERRLREIRVAAALIKQFTHLLSVAPDPAQALRQFNALTIQLLSCPDWASEFHDLQAPGVLETVAEMMGMSRFLWEDYLRLQHDNLLPVLLDPTNLGSRRTARELSKSIGGELESCDGAAESIRALNDFKDREMFRVDLRYITGRIDLGEFGAELTDLADVVVEEAFKLSVDTMVRRFGAPRLASGAECGWAIFGLGKFGGGDMGFGSDIELMFVYREEGLTVGAEPVRVSTFYDEAVREFLKVVESRHQGIFEIDMRLRPYGNKGALASSAAALIQYYGPGGDVRQFERLALVKMRPIAGSMELVRDVMEVVRDFVYSPSGLDIDNVQYMRARQASELVSSGDLNAKLSLGGVVDIEYFVQAWQIVCGRDDPALRVTNTMRAVDQLRDRGYFSADLAERIGNSYTFLRRLIDALRVVRGNSKDLNVPPPHSRESQYLAHRLSLDSPEQLTNFITKSMNTAQRLWEESPPGV